MGNILVVDDSVVVRRMLGFILEKGGHAVRFAVDGQEGLAAVHELRPDLVLSDLEMPVMDGISFVRRLREDADTSDIPVVMLTASADHDHHRAIEALGVQGFATKPVRSSDVIELVDSLIRVA
jgi:chemosensory pili system protein ChpA (sensor histidine kinase/response regulator)